MMMMMMTVNDNERKCSSGNVKAQREESGDERKANNSCILCNDASVELIHVEFECEMNRITLSFHSVIGTLLQLRRDLFSSESLLGHSRLLMDCSTLNLTANRRKHCISSMPRIAASVMPCPRPSIQ